MKPYYQDSAVTIYHGDYREFSGNLPGIIVCDPPYNVALGTKSHASRQEGYANSGDDLGLLEYKKLLSELMLHCLDCQCAIITPGNSNQHIWPCPTWTMAWLKDNGVTRTPLTRGQEMNHACWEPIMIYGKLRYPPKSDVVKCSIGLQPEAEDHPCPKPRKLIEKLISFTEGDIIDYMMGSGTTLRAAKNLGRRAIGIEIEERYCEIAAKRMEQEVFDFSSSQSPAGETMDTAPLFT